MDQPVKGPDGMRAANGKLFVAENGSGRISAITVNGDKASVAAVEPAGDTLDRRARRRRGRVDPIPK
jgi:hypothetical protein